MWEIEHRIDMCRYGVFAYSVQVSDSNGGLNGIISQLNLGYT